MLNFPPAIQATLAQGWRVGIIYQHRYQSYLEMSEVAAELKKHAKQQPGSKYVRDRRLSSALTWT